MPVSAATLRLMMDAGLVGDQLLAVVEAIDADMEAARPVVDLLAERRRAKDRDRKRDVRAMSAGMSADKSADIAPLPDKEKCPKEINPSPPSSDANASGADAPPDERTRLFRWGLETVCGLTGRPPDPVRKLLGRWLKAMNDDCRGLNRILEDAVTTNPAEPVSWIEGVIRSRGTGPPRAGPQGGFASIALELRNNDDQRRFDQPEPAYRAPAAHAPGVVALPRYPAQRR